MSNFREMDRYQLFISRPQQLGKDLLSERQRAAVCHTEIQKSNNNNKERQLELKQPLMIAPWLVDIVLDMEQRDPYERQIILTGGVRNLGKTTGLIQFIRHLGSKQTPDKNGVRTLKFFLLRESYRQIDQVIESFDEWFDEVGEYSKVRKCQEFGYAYKDLQKAPKICLYERTPDLLGLIMGKPYIWDGTTTKIEITCYSYNKPTSDANMRGGNMGSGMLNEAQTLPVKAFQTARGSYGRPEGKVQYPTILLDHNMPKSEDIGYDWLKSLYRQDDEALEGESIKLVKLPAPYIFVPDEDSDFLLQGRRGRLDENPDFLRQVPHLKSLDTYKGFRLEGDDAVLRDMLGRFGLKHTGNLLYHEFDSEVHAAHRIDPPDPLEFPDNYIIIGMDFGYQPSVTFCFVDQGVAYFFHEIVIDDINFFQLMETYFIPYIEEHLPYYYANNQIVIVGDPTSGNRRSAIKSATPLGVLSGETDVNGDEDGDDVRYNFEHIYPSPCGNSWEHRMHVTKAILGKPNGCHFDPRMHYTMQMFEEYISAAGGGKPKKKAGDLLHGTADSFQYVSAYIAAGFETHTPEPIKRKKRRKSKKKRYR